MAKPKVYRGYSNSRGDANQAFTAGQSYYTPNSKGVVSARNGRAFKGRRMMTTTGQQVGYKEDRAKGKGVRYGNQVLVSRSQQYKAIRSAFGLQAG